MRSLRAILIVAILSLPVCVFAAGLPSGEPTPRLVQGTVVGPTDQPMAGARVDLRDADDNILADTLSDTDGRFAIFDLRLAAGSYVMHASASGYAADEESFKVGAESQPELTIALKLKAASKERGISSRYTVVKVFYATDRKQAVGEQTVRYLGVKSDKGTLAYGSCEVSIPESHTFAQIERPSVWRFEFHADPDKHLTLQSVTPEARDRFFHDVSASVAASSGKEAFVFVHGYNVSFEDATIRTAQLAYDFGFKGAPILYSWPSRASLFGYHDDEKNVAETVGNLKQFLQDVAQSSGARVVHLIAHSMGNRALLPAVSQLAADPHFQHMDQFHTIISAAPDVDRDVFISMMQQILKPAKSSVALYVSEHDQALAASHALYHAQHRAGEGGSQSVVIQGMDTIDVSAISTDALGHSYYGDSRSVVTDLLGFFSGKHPPRPGLTRGSVGSLGYWLLRPAN
jgi:esterase/lipase superfamily enzyme